MSGHKQQKQTHSTGAMYGWMVAAFFTGTALAYILVDNLKRGCKESTRIEKPIIIYNDNLQKNYSTNDFHKSTTTSSSSNQKNNYVVTSKGTKKSTVASQPSHNNSIDSKVKTEKDTIIPGSVPNAINNPALINEWLGVKKYDQEKRQPDVVGHHYKIRRMKTKNPCKNK